MGSQRAAAVAELKVMIRRYGESNAVRYFVAGLSIADAQQAFEAEQEIKQQVAADYKQCQKVISNRIRQYFQDGQ